MLVLVSRSNSHSGLLAAIRCAVHEGSQWAVRFLSGRATARLCKGRLLRLAAVGAEPV
jgi:hypothetical protein